LASFSRSEKTLDLELLRHMAFFVINKKTPLLFRGENGDGKNNITGSPLLRNNCIIYLMTCIGFPAAAAARAGSGTA